MARAVVGLWLSTSLGCCCKHLDWICLDCRSRELLRILEEET